MTEPGTDKVARVTTAGTVTDFPLASGSTPAGITTGPSGSNTVWFAESGGNRIGSLTTAGQLTEFTVPTANSHPTAITLGADGNLSFTEASANQIGQVTPLGVFTELHTGLTANSGLEGITAGPNGTIWFSEAQSNRLGMFLGSFNQRLVAQFYLDLLQRPADSDGLAFYSGQLQQGTSASQVVLEIESSAEYRTLQVQGLYQSLLKRAADPAGLANFVAFLMAGGTVEQVAVALTGSAEYFQTRGGGTNNGFLNALYLDALNRAIDPGGLTTYTQALANGTTTAQVAAAIYSSASISRTSFRASTSSICFAPRTPRD